MTDSFFTPSLRPRRTLFLACGLLLAALALPIGARAQEEQKDSKIISDKVSEGLGKIKPLTDAKDWDGTLALIDELMKIAQPGGSYEQAVLNDIKAKIYLQKNEFNKAIGPMETALQISDRHSFFDKKYTAEIAKLLTQLYYQEAIVPGRTKDQQMANFLKASSYIKRVIDDAGSKPNGDDMILYATILYNRAVSNPDKVDPVLIKESQQTVERALLTVIKPKPQFYEFLLATLTQQNDYLRGAETLELLVKLNPNGSGYWSQLAAMYLALAASNEKDKQLSLQYNVRSILAIERAQAAGQMRSTKDNFNLISIYLLIGQFDRACDMLEAGLKNGTIDQEQKNWELLSYYYQQADKPLKAIEILKEAAQRYPKAGQLDFQAAQIYYALDRPEDAFRESRSAATKGVGEKASQVWQFIAYCGFELHKLPEALEAANNAIATETKNDPQLPKLKQAIEDAIRDRELQAEILKAKQKL